MRRWAWLPIIGVIDHLIMARNSTAPIAKIAVSTGVLFASMVVLTGILNLLVEGVMRLMRIILRRPPTAQEPD